MTIPSLSESDVSALLTYGDLIPFMAQALTEFSAGKVQQPVRRMLTIEPEQRYLGIMPAAMTSAMGAKLVSFYPKNAGSAHPTHLASILLFDPEHGQPLAVVDGRLITEMRTAATSAAVSRLAAPEKSRVLALVGSGVQVAAHLEALKEVFPLDEIRVWSRSSENARRFADAHGVTASLKSQNPRTSSRTPRVHVLATSSVRFWVTDAYCDQAASSCSSEEAVSPAGAGVAWHQCKNGPIRSGAEQTWG